MVRFMRDYAKIFELCGIMRFWVYYAGSHNRIISEGPQNQKIALNVYVVFHNFSRFINRFSLSKKLKGLQLPKNLILNKFHNLSTKKKHIKYSYY